MPRRAAMSDVTQALGLDHAPGLVAIVGGGGKSSLLFALGNALPGRVVLTTPRTTWKGKLTTLKKPTL